MACVGPGLLRESQSRDGNTRTRPGFKGRHGTECVENRQPPEGRRIARFAGPENRPLRRQA